MTQLWETILTFKEMEYGIQNNGRAEQAGCLFFSAFSLLLTFVNLFKQNLTMTFATIVMTVGFLTAAFFSYQRRYAHAKILIAVLCGIFFSFYCLSGNQDGFAILWVILVPVIGPLLIGLFTGTILNLYFMTLLVIMFYSPMSSRWAGIYSDTFMLRFPALYLACFGASTILMYQRNLLFNEIHRQAYHDPLTDLYNRRYYNELFNRLQDPKLLEEVTVFSIDINGLKAVNDTLGHEKGDSLILASAKLIQSSFPEDSCCRIGGDEFIVISTRKNPIPCIQKLQEAADRFHSLILPKVSLSIGYAVAAENPELSLQDLIALADKNMYAEKARYYQTSGRDRRRSQL